MAKERNSRKFDFSKSNENRFDFTKDEPDVVETPQQSNASSNPDAHTTQSNNKSNTGKIVGSIVAAAAIIAGIFFFINNKESEGGNDGTPTEVIAQNTENQNDGNDAPAAETSNKDASAESKGVPANGSEAPAAENADESPAIPSSSANPAKANDNQVAERPAKRNPATIAEPAKPAKSKPASTETTKPFSATSAPVSGDVEENARRVIRGDFGNGQERRDKLGSSYSEIQGKVNEMFRQGIVN